MVGEVVKVKNMEFHKACFCCTTCKKKLTASDDVSVKFSKPYCKACNPNPSSGGGGQQTKFCGSCGTPSTGGNFCNGCGAKLVA